MKCYHCNEETENLIEIEGSPYCYECRESLFEYCPDCEEYVEELIDTPDGMLCGDCADKFSCSFCDRVEYDNEEINSNWVCPDCIREHYIVCDNCNDYEDRDDSVSDDYTTLCRSCYEDGYFTCDDCDNIEPLNECYSCDDGAFCSNCADNHRGERPTGKPITSDSFETVRTTRWYGVEIETDKGDYEATSPRWGIQTDISIDGMELVSPLLQGDEGLESIRRIYKRVEPTFDEKCGIHVHIDIRDLDDNQRMRLINAFQNTKQLWYNCVDITRHSHKFCRGDLPPTDCDFQSYLARCRKNNGYGDCGRYRWVNVLSYEEHGSIEIRLLEATNDVEKVVGWVANLVNFVSDTVEEEYYAQAN